MSKIYAMRNAGTNNGSSQQNNNGGTKKKDRFQEAYEQGTRIYEQNRSQLVQQTQQLQTQLQGIGNGPLTYQQARNVRTYYDNLQSLTTYGFDTSEQIQAIGGFARQNNQLLSTYKTEKDYNNGYLYPARYQGLSGSSNTTNQLNGLRRTIGALRQSGGDKAKADALQAEYDWLKQHQYDYWSQDELGGAIKEYEARISKNKDTIRLLNPSTGDLTVDNDPSTESYARRSRLSAENDALNAQLSSMKTAKEANAYRDIMAGWGEQDFKNMGELATEVTKRDEADKASTWSAMAAAFGGSPDGGLSAHAQAESHQPRITELYSYFRDKGLSNEQIDSLVSYFQRNQNMMQRQKDMQELSAFAKEHPVLASAISVPINLLSGVGYVDLALQNATAGTDAITGEKQRVDQYSALTLMGDASSAMRGAVSEDMGGFGKFLYNTGMSMADFLAAAPAGGGATELILGGAAAMQATREAYARGASDGQALGMGAWAGASEAAFEHLSLGSLKAMKTSVTAARGTFKQILVDMAKQGFVEGSEETFTTISNTLGDAFIMGDKSALNTAIRDYMEKDGLSEAEATRKAYTDWAMNTALDFAGGALSGGVLGGGNRVRMNWAQGVQGQAILDRGQELEVINTALAMPEGSEARVFAEHLTETKMKSGDYTATEIGQLAWAVEAQRAQTKNEDNPASDMPRTHPVVTTAADGSGATVMATQMSEVAEALVAAGDTHQEALAKTKVIEAVVAGDAALTGSQINKVGFNALTAQSTVDVIKQYTGVDITANGKTASAIRKSILAARDQQAERAAQIKAQGEAIHAARAAVDAAAAQNDADAAAKATAMLDEAQAAASTGARAQVADSAAEETGAPAETAEAPVGDTTAAATAASETAAPAGDDTLHFSNGGSLTFKEFVEAYHDMNPDNPASKRELAQRFGELLDAQAANGGTLSAKEMNRAISGEAASATTDTRGKTTGKTKPASKAKSTGKAKSAGKAESDLAGKARAELEASRNTRETEKGKTVKVAEGVEFAAREGGLQELSNTQIWTGALVYRFMKNIGIKKVVYDAAYVGSDANALIEDGTIYINPEAKGMDNRGTILWTLGHEISHPATNGSKKDNALAEKILSTFEKVAKLGALKEGKLQSQVTARTTTVNKTLARYKAFYEAHGNAEMAARVDEHFASQEVAGDWLGWAFQSREIMERIGRVDPSTLTRMQRAVARLQQTVTSMQRAQARKQYGTGIGIIDADADSAAEAEKIIRGLADDVNSALKKSELNQSFKPKSKAKAKSKTESKAKAETKAEAATAEEAVEAPAEAPTETSTDAPAEKDRFSVSEPVEYTKNLVALHNFSAMSMRRILRDGGMPTASIAVVKHDMAHTAFGDWTIVLPRESVDPQANPNNKMWGGDAYTPMVNHLETPHAVDEDATDAIIDELVDKTGDPYYNRILSEVVLTMRRGGVDKAISDYVQNFGLDPDLRDVFNADQSEDVKAARSDPELLGATDEALRYYWPGNPVAEDMLADAAEAVDDALGTDFLEQVENGDDTAFLDFCNRVNETPAAVANWMHERFDGAVSEAPAHVMNVDRYTGEVLEEQPYTLENVVRMMYDYFPHQSFDTDPSDLQDPDLNGWQSAAVPKINSIDEAHELSDRLRKDRVEHRDKLTKLRDQLISVTKNILPFARHMSFQNVAELLSSTASAKSTSEIKNAFFKEGAILPENLAEKVLEVNQAFADLPQQYFEAKAERVIDLDEMKKGLIVAPKDAPKDLLDQVRQVFPNVVTYDTQRPETRVDAVNSPVGQNLRFSISDADYLNAVESGDMKTAREMVREAAERAGWRTKYLYHGTQSFGFTKFDLSKLDDGASIFLVDDIATAETYSGKRNVRRISGPAHKAPNFFSMNIEELVEWHNKNMPYDDKLLVLPKKEQARLLKAYKDRAFEAMNAAEAMTASPELPIAMLEAAGYNAMDVSTAMAYFNEVAGLKHLTEPDDQHLWNEIAHYYRRMQEDLSRDIRPQVNSYLPVLMIHGSQLMNEPQQIARLMRMMKAGAEMYWRGSQVSENQYSFDSIYALQGSLQYEVDNVDDPDAGNYELFAKYDDPLVIDADGRNWNEIRLPKSLVNEVNDLNENLEKLAKAAERDGDAKKAARYRGMTLEATRDRYYRTRDICSFARAIGYDSVVFESIIDDGGESPQGYGLIDPANITVVFDPASVKSADPVTYDDNGNVIPLSERFNPKNDDIRYSINPDFASDIDEWDQNGRKAHTIFDLGTTGEVLQSLGATEGDIRLDSEKIETILKEHPEMTLDDIKALGEIVNNPVLVLKSRNVNRSAPNTRVVMIGDHKASNGKYVLAILDLSPNNSNLRVAGMQKLSSSYTKLDTPSTPDAFRQLLKMSYVMYYDPKRAAKVLSAAGLRLRSDAGSASDKKAARELPLTGLQSRPGHYSQSGFVGSVAYQRDFVKPSEYIVKMYGAKPSDVFEDIPARRYSVTRDQFDNDEDFRAFYRDLFGGLGLTERAHAETQADNTPPDREVSLVRSNTFDHLFTSAEKRMDELKEGEFEYDRVTEVQSMSEARERLDADYEGEREYLENHSFTNGTDLDTAMGILSVELANARETGDYTDAVDWAHVIRANGTAAGQLVQAFAKYSRTPEGVLVNAIETLEESDLDPDRQDEIIERIFEFSRTLHDIERGDEEGRGDLIDLILEQAEMRNTKVSKTTLKNLSSGQITWLYDLALAQMDQIARDFIKPSFAKGLATFQTISHLFNIRTTNRNLGSNTLFSPIAAIGNNLAIIPDAIASVFTGQRYVGFDRWIFSKATWKGMREGGAKAWVEVALDVQPEPTQRDKYGTARRTWKMTGGRAARVGSTIEKMLGYELNFTDEFHKGGIRAEIMQSLEPMVRNGVITTEMAEQWAEQEALYRAFQDDTYMGNLLAILKNGMNTIGIGRTGRKIGNLEIKEFGLGDLVQKYTQVPGALFTRAVEFSPVGYAKCLYLMAQMSSAAKESKKANAKYETLQARADESSGKDALVSRAFRAKTAAETAQVQAATAQRMFALAVGRATTGTGLLALFATLALKGVLRRADDEDDPNVKAQNLSEGITGTQLNTSALARMIRGGSAEYQTGDHLVSVDWIEPINGLMTMGALIAKDTDGDQSFADKAKSYGLNSLDGLYLAFSDLPTMQTLKTVRDTVNYYDEEDSPTGSLPLDIGIEVARGSLTGFIPSPVRQIAQATDPVQRDAYTSDSVAQQTWDQIRNSIPGLRQQLPVKKDNLGNDRKQEGGLLGVLNATFLPGNIRTYQQSEYSKEMYEVYKATGDSSFYPGKSAPYSISMSIDGEQTQYKLDADQRVQYQRTRGATMYTLIKDMHDDPVWKAATPEERAEMLSMAKNLATYAANQEIAKANGKTYTNNEYEKTNGALDVGYTVASWQNIRSAMSGVEGVDEDGDGKADDGTKKAAALQVLVDLDLTDEQKVYWYRGSSYAEETDKVGEAMAAGISANDWFSAKIALSNAHGTDNNGDGKTDSGSVQADVIRILMSMNLTPEQRRLLFLQMYPQSTKKANGTNWGD